MIKSINEKIKEDNKVHLLESEVEILKIKPREAEAKVNLIQEKLQESEKERENLESQLATKRDDKSMNKIILF